MSEWEKGKTFLRCDAIMSKKRSGYMEIYNANGIVKVLNDN